jgi:hypothetical protein
MATDVILVFVANEPLQDLQITVASSLFETSSIPRSSGATVGVERVRSDNCIR